MNLLERVVAPALWSFKGRSPRKQFWAVLVATQMGILLLAPLLSMLAYAAFVVAPALFVGVQLLVGAVLVVFQCTCLYAILAVIYRRTQDLDMPGGFGIATVFVGPFAASLLIAGIALILPGTITAWLKDANDAEPLLSAAFFFLVIVFVPICLLGCFRGTTGPNQYGDDPLGPPTDTEKRILS